MVEIESYGAGSLPGQPVIPGGGKSARKLLFPAGIFFMLFLIEAIMAAGAAGAYFLYAGAGRITEIVSDTRSHAETLAGVLGGAAELSYRAKSYARLRDLLHDRIDGRTVDEAFFVLKSGKIIAHSDPAVEEKLGDDRTAAGKAYDLDLILRPVTEKSAGILFTDCNIASKPVPFDRGQRDLIRQYLYRDIDTSGWLASRAVLGKKKPVGAVCIILSKAKIHAFIREHVDRTLRVFQLAPRRRVRGFAGRDPHRVRPLPEHQEARARRAAEHGARSRRRAV